MRNLEDSESLLSMGWQGWLQLWLPLTKHTWVLGLVLCLWVSLWVSLIAIQRNHSCLFILTQFQILFLQFLTKFRVPHPGRVGGRFFVDIAMPLMLDWVLGGNRLVLSLRSSQGNLKNQLIDRKANSFTRFCSEKLEGRPPSCRLTDKVCLVLSPFHSNQI